MSHPLQHLYDQVPKVNCKGLCGRDKHNTCCGPIGCSELEAKHLDEFLGIQSPWNSIGGGAVMMDVESLFPMMLCPHLGPDGRCRSYEVRPMICRVWGTFKEMKCPWGCEPERWLTRTEVNRLLKAAEDHVPPQCAK